MDVLYKWQTTKRRRFPDFVGGSSEHLAFEWDGQEVVLGFETIERVVIRTTDEGPFLPDVFWVVETATEEWIVEDEDPRARLLLVTLQQRDDFDNDAVIQAMQSVHNALFVCWTRETKGANP